MNFIIGEKQDLWNNIATARIRFAWTRRKNLPKPVHRGEEGTTAPNGLYCSPYLPFNIASYALFTMMVAQVCGYEPGDFVWTGGDCHIYSNHFDQVTLQLSREPWPLPTMRINPFIADIFAFQYEDFVLEGYDPHPTIRGEVAV